MERSDACPVEEWDAPTSADFHRPKVPIASFCLPAAVAQPISIKEIANIDQAKNVMDKGWKRLLNKGVWNLDRVVDWSVAARKARDEGRIIHLGRVFGIMVLKGSELPPDDPNRKYKYRVDFQG